MMPVFTHEEYLNNSDWGFSFHDETANTVIVAETKALTDRQAADIQKRLDLMYNAILPLLKNLSENPDKKYILWADRVSKIEGFRKKLEEIYKG